MALNLDLVDNIGDEWDDDEEEESLEEVPTSDMLRIAKDLADKNASILGVLLTAEPSAINLEELRLKYPEVGEEVSRSIETW